MQIPFVVPVRTGVVLLEGDASSSNTNEIVTLMGHSEVALRVHLPGHFSFKISWYQGMEGFTGWHGGALPLLWSLQQRLGHLRLFACTKTWLDHDEPPLH